VSKESADQQGTGPTTEARIIRVQKPKAGAAYLDMLLEVLRTLERLATEITLVWLEGHMNSDMRGDVVAFDGCDPTLRPLTLQVQIIGAFSANMFLADMFLIQGQSEL
jgi:hypothetical protein